MALFHCLDRGKEFNDCFFFFFGQGVQINRREIICRHHREHLPSAQTPPAAPGKGVVTVHRSAHRSAATRRSSILSRDDGALGGGVGFSKTGERRGAPQRGHQRGRSYICRSRKSLDWSDYYDFIIFASNITARAETLLLTLKQTNKQQKKTTPPVSSLQTFQLFSDARRRQRSMWRMWRVRRGRAGNTSRGVGVGGGGEPVRRCLNQVTCESRRWFGFTVVCF